MRTLYFYSPLTLLTLFHLANPLYAQDSLNGTMRSSRCQILLEKRQEKIQFKQKIEELIERNTKLSQRIPTHKKELALSVQLNAQKLQREKELGTIKIQHLNETIVRSGCPGIDYK